MRKYTLCALIVCLSIVLVPTAGANDKRVKKELKALYARKAELSRKQDVEALMRLNTLDYTVILDNGKTISRQQLEDRLKGYFSSGQLVRQISYTYEVKEIKVNGNEAVVLVEQKDKRIQIRRDGEPHEVEANVIHRDTWVRTAEGWKLKLTEELKQTKFTVDGKPA